MNKQPTSRKIMMPTSVTVAHEKLTPRFPEYNDWPKVIKKGSK